MLVVLILVLIAVLFGYIFAKLDSLSKACKIISDDARKLQEEVETIKHTNLS